MPRWAWLLLAGAVVFAVPASVLLTLANDYQPLGYGSGGVRNLTYPGLPAGHGLRTVNTFGRVREDVYVPPQRGVFYLFADVANWGSRAVIIEGVSLPQGSALTSAGHVKYARPPSTGNGAIGIPLASRVLDDVKLGPGQELLIAIPVRSWPCAERYSWATVPSFDVTYRFLFFRHVAALPWGDRGNMLIMRAPYGKQGQPGVVCV